MVDVEIRLPGERLMSRFVAVDASAENSPACAGTCCAPSRRGFLRSLAAMASVAAVPKSASAQGTKPLSR
jgi:hypothetical protein